MSSWRTHVAGDTASPGDDRMGRLYFGRQEEVRCICDVDIHGADGEALCLAYKTTTFHFGAGVYLRDDGYVLRARVGSADRYYPLDDEAIRAHQSETALPTPLPAYAIPFADYVWGYLMWIILAGMVASGALRRYLRARKRRRAESLVRGDGASASSGPSLSTEGDRFIREHVTPHLRAGERVLQQAYVADRDVESAGFIGALAARGSFAVLTTERIILLSGRLIVLGPALETRDVESIEGASIRDFQLDGDAVVLELSDGESRRLVTREHEKAFSNQRAFAVEMVRQLERWRGTR